MRILYALYPSNRWSFGGKERHVREISAVLQAQGLDLTLLDPWNWQDNHRYDLVHLFGSEYYQHELAARAKARGMRLVVSSVLVYADARSERLTRWWRWLDRLVPVSTSFGLRQQTLRLADRVICTSQHEAHVARKVYGVAPGRISQIPWTVDPLFAEATPELFHERTGLRDVVLSVGRIEPRKNQLGLIEAMNSLGLPLVLIGDFDETHPSYCQQVRQALAQHRWITHLPALPSDDPLLASAYAAARVHVLISQHETLGMVSLEAALAGANIVTTALPALREYLGHDVRYVNPTDRNSIRQQISAAYHAPCDERLRTRLLQRYSTPAVAQQLAALYQRILEEGDTC